MTGSETPRVGADGVIILGDRLKAAHEMSAENGAAAQVAEKPAEDAASEPNLTITIKLYPDGRRRTEAFDDKGRTATIAAVRHALRECANHYEDLLVAVLAEQAAKKLIAQAAASKDRNGLARFLDFLRH